MGGKGLNAPSRKPEAHAAYQRIWYKRHREQVLLKQKEKRGLNKEKDAAYQRAYFLKNKERLRVYQNNYRRKYNNDKRKEEKPIPDLVRAYDANTRTWVWSKVQKCPQCLLYRPTVSFRWGIHGIACSRLCEKLQEKHWRQKTEEALWIQESKHLLMKVREMTKPMSRRA